MMRILSLALAAALVVGVSAAPRPASAAPDGSYRSSCRDLQIDGSILSATCQTAYGGWQRTSIDYKRCQGDISNDRGRLICRREWGDTRDWRDGDRGDGDWRGDGDHRGDGDWRGDGRGDGWDGGGWDGGDRGDWRGGDRGDRGDRGWGGITLFSRPDFYGRAFTAARDTYNLDNTGFNDRAQSVRIDGGGYWQLCEDAGFRGHCVTVSRSVPDLNRLGLGGRVSSLRRLR